MNFTEFFKKIFRRLNKYLAGPNLYVRFFEDNLIWENTVFFESYTGQSFQGNPYYIFKEMLKRDDCANMKLYIAAIETKECKKKLKERDLLNKNVKIVTFGSVKYVNALCHCKYLVNNVAFNSDFIKKSNQIYLNTWHGTGPKCCGNLLSATPKAFATPQRNFILANHIICPNEHSFRMFTSDHMLSDISENKLIHIGYPRNTPFFDFSQKEKVIQENALHGKKIVVYLPTWRGIERLSDDCNAIAEINKIAATLSDTHVFFCKLHPNMLRFKLSADNCRAIPDKYELYEFLCCADYLITDWSSVYTDFANKSSNIILFQYDREYMLNTRGLYVDFVKNSVFPIAKTGEDVLYLLSHDFYVEGYKEFLQTYCKNESISSTNKIIDSLLVETNLINTDITLIYIDKRLSENEINGLKSFVDSKIFKFVVSDSLSDDTYLYFNGIKNFEYLILSRSSAKNISFNANKKRVLGDYTIDTLLYISGTLVPEYLLKSANKIVEINL